MSSASSSSSSSAQQKLHKHAQHLGIDVQRERWLLPIAEAALVAPLPAPWESHIDAESGNTYYYDPDAQKTSWESPLDAEFQQAVQIQRKLVLRCAKEIGVRQDEDDERLFQLAVDMACAELPANWSSHITDTQETYFEDASNPTPRNASTHTTWTSPYTEYYREQVALMRSGGAARGNESSSSSCSRSQSKSQQQQPAHGMRSISEPFSHSAPAQQERHLSSATATSTASSSLQREPVSTGAAAAPACALGLTAYRVGYRDEKHTSRIAPVAAPPGKLQSAELYDEFPYPKGYFASPEFVSKSAVYDEFFGPPVLKNAGHKKPAGPPKAARPQNSAAQQQQQQQQVFQQQRSGGAMGGYAAAAAAVNPGGMMIAGNHPAAPAVGVGVGVGTGGPLVGAPQQQQEQPLIHHPQGQRQQQQQQQAAASNAASSAFPPAVMGFAVYLGVTRPDAEAHLLPLVQQCLASPLPAPWMQQQDPSSGRVFYGNPHTKQTSWDHPAKGAFLAAIDKARQEHKDHPASHTGHNNIDNMKQQQQQAAQHNKFQRLQPAQKEALEVLAAQCGVELVDGQQKPLAVPEHCADALIWGVLQANVEELGFAVHKDAQGKIYYEKKSDGSTSWDSPIVAEVKRRIIQSKN